MSATSANIAEQIKQLKVVDLKAALAELGLPTTGRKDELVHRLLEAKQASLPAPKASKVSANDTNKSNTPSTKSFSPSTSLKPPSTNSLSGQALGGKSSLALATSLMATKGSTSPSMNQMPPSAVDKKLETLNTAIEANAKRVGSSAFADEEAEKRASRAARFNLGPTETDKRLRRIERFGLASSQDGKASLIEPLDKLKQRQARFGCTTSTALAKTEAEEQKLRRLQRFGIADSVD